MHNNIASVKYPQNVVSPDSLNSMVKGLEGAGRYIRYIQQENTGERIYIHGKAWYVLSVVLHL